MNVVVAVEESVKPVSSVVKILTFYEKASADVLLSYWVSAVPDNHSTLSELIKQIVISAVFEY